MTFPASEHEGIIGVTFPSDDETLVGRLYLARGADPKPTALLLHGCPGLELNLDIAATLRDRGWNALVFHYRGCWGSSGRYDMRTITRDVTAAVDYLQAAEPSVDPGRLAVVGHSLGGWAAILTAAADTRLRAVAVYGAAVDLRAIDMTPGETEREFTRFLAATPQEFAAAREAVVATVDPLREVTAIAPRPLLVVHGTDDRWVSVEQARMLRDTAGGGCRYVEVADAGHDFAWHRPFLRGLLADWLGESGL